MFGFDSVSQVVWRTHLTETYKYFIETLNGVIFEGYNIVGDGTPQALLPILTGKTEVELQEARKAFLVFGFKCFKTPTSLFWRNTPPFKYAELDKGFVSYVPI